jgi:hypothetical protein
MGGGSSCTGLRLGWMIWIGILLLVLGLILPLAWIYGGELGSKDQPLRWRGGGLSVEFLVCDTQPGDWGAEPVIIPKIELLAEDKTNVVMFPNNGGEVGLEEQYNLLIRNLISYFKSRLSR